MGDRHNIGLVQYGQKEKFTHILWLYSHDGFYTDEVEGFAASLAHALDEARPRWDDHSYFNRIVIFTLGDSVRGIHTGPPTGDEHKRYIVDSKNQKVHLMDNWSWDGNLVTPPHPIAEFSFENFIAKYRKHDKTVRDEY